MQAMREASAATEAYLKQVLAGLSAPQPLQEAMGYTLMAGGKRLRPYLVMAFCRLCGGDEKACLPLASAIEMIHTYSLIHDDLPCMDDDDLRRGMPSSHIKFGEANALLAGDALLTEAFHTAAKATLPAENTLKAIEVLAEKAGACGMVGGQVLDLAAEGQKPGAECLTKINQNKTAALMEAACMMGAIAAGAGEAQITAAEAYGRSLGLTFQLTDDLLDVLGDEATLGKPLHSDEASGKTTYVGLLGIEKTRALAAEETAKAKQALRLFGDGAEELQKLADALLVRVM